MYETKNNTIGMNESTIRLAPFPGSPKSDFLATVVPIQGINTKDDEVGEDLPFEIILDQYTREPWSVSTFSQQKWKQLHLKSIDGKGKLPGFLNYLKERKKAAFGTWILEDDHTRKGIFLVPFDQSSSPDGNNGTEKEEDMIFCRYTLDDSILRKKKAPPPSLSAQVSAPPTAIQKKPTIPVASSSSLSTVSSTKKTKPNNNKNGKKKSSFMGNLLAAQERTDRHLAAVPKSAVSTDSKSEDNLANSSSTSSQTIIAKFRTDIEQKLLDFKNNLSQNVIEIPVTLSKITSMLVGEDKLKVSMDVLKYIVYEQSEEIGEGLNWIAAKKSSEFFIDEAIICIYKDGHAPLDVLEDLNKGDLPDEIKQQQRAMREAAVKQMKSEDAQKLKKIQEHTLSRKNQASSKNDEPSKLNTKKRDRRTIAQIQDDMSKKQKYDLDNYE